MFAFIFLFKLCKCLYYEYNILLSFQLAFIYKWRMQKTYIYQVSRMCVFVGGRGKWGREEGRGRGGGRKCNLSIDNAKLQTIFEISVKWSRAVYSDNSSHYI